ncbi:MAG: hypothetical protein KBT68_05920, partial [bacterium]|nr:hypothetical protein [Candidatus Colisoma equi]
PWFKVQPGDILNAERSVARILFCKRYGQQKNVRYKMKLWIIGNGFDLFHGLNTRYLNYKAFLCQRNSCKRKNCEKKPDELPREVCRNCCKREIVNSTCPVRKFYNLPRDEMKEDLWRDLEESCSIDLDALLKRLKGWSGTKRNTLGESAAEVLAHGNLDFAPAFTGNYLYEWFKEIEERELSGKGQNDRVIDIDDKDVFLTFNYTKTLQHIYCIPEEQILHVHGRLAEVEPKCKKTANRMRSPKSGRNIHACLAFGSPDMTKAALNAAIKRFKKSQNICTKEVKTLRSCLAGLIELLDKDVDGRIGKVKRFVCKHCGGAACLDEVVVAGHSLGRIDAPYFDFLADYLRDARWRFLSYSESALGKALEFCKKNNLNGYYMPWETARKSSFSGAQYCASQGVLCQCSNNCQRIEGRR